ncbi:MAG: hypothetical protein M1825_002034 [Sarcosagium campestre]|nr:MAG: hypothetical protein M1825_002034 [Sarcosagium campestre]
MQVSFLLIPLSLLVSTALAVFSDEAFHTDYHLPLLGVPDERTTFFHRPKSASKASLLYTLSEKLVLGAVNPKDGTIVWRQRLGTESGLGQRGYLRAGEEENVVISAAGPRVSSWDALNGRLIWSKDFPEENPKDLEIIELGPEGKGAKDAIVLFEHEGHGTVRRLDGNDGLVEWEFKDNSGDIPHQVSTSTTTVFLVSLHPTGKRAYRIKVTSLDPVTGTQLSQYTLSSDTDVTGADSVLFVGANTASPAVAWTDKDKKVLKVNVLGSKKLSTFDLKSDGDSKIEQVTIHAPHLVQSLPHFLVHFQSLDSHWAEVFHIDVAAATVSRGYSLPKLAGKGAFSTSTVDANVYFVRNTETEITLFSSTSHGILGRWSAVNKNSGGNQNFSRDRLLDHAVSEVLAKSSSSFAVRSALTTSDGDWVLSRNGEVDWTRSEGLSGAVAAEWVKLKEKVDLAKELEIEGHKSILAAYSHRVRRHVRDLQHLPAWLKALPKRLLGSLRSESSDSDGASDLQQDNFGFRKLIVVATEKGWLYALDSGNHGRVLWSCRAQVLDAGATWDVKGIFVDYGSDTLSVRGAAGDVVIVEIATGELVERTKPDTKRRVERTVRIQEGSRNVLVDVYEGGEASDIGRSTAPTSDVFLVVRRKNGAVRGLKYLPNGESLAAQTIWEFGPSEGERTVGVVSAPTPDPVASIGKVLGNRSVMYKYLNPNLVLVISVNDGASTASINLLDAVTGAVMFSAIHQGVDTQRPIPALTKQNWFVYSFFGDISSRAGDSPSSAASSKGYQLVVAELYESDIPNDRGPLGSAANFSSTTPSSDTAFTKPHVVSQSFLLSEGIRSLAVTTTRQGITASALLATLAQSNAIVAIPKAVLDPRRPVGRDPTPAEQEEGLARYRPSLELDPKWYLTHARDVVGIRHVITSPALLESTSLVFAYGLDIFGTRVAPSMSFDVLGKGFSKLQLVGTVLALGVGVLLLAPMVRKKQVDSRWQVS